MAFIILFIYLNYMLKAGYDVTVFDWICLFVVGLLQIASWFVRTGILTTYIKPTGDKKKVRRLDDWFRE